MILTKSIIFKDKAGRRHCIDSLEILSVSEVGKKTEDKPTPDVEIKTASTAVTVNMTLDQVLSFLAEAQGITKKADAPAPEKSRILKPEPNIVTN